MNAISLLRSGLALSTLLTLLFNPIDVLFPQVLDNCQFYNKFQVFSTNFSCLIVKNIYIFKLISILVLILVLSGFYPRITGILHALVSFSFFKTCPIIDGGDMLNSNLTILMVPLLLFDSRFNQWQSSFETNIKLSQLTSTLIFIIKLQIAILYFSSSVSKMFQNEWVEGTAIWYWFNHEIFGSNFHFKHIVNNIIQNKVIIHFVSWFVIVLELMIAIAFLGISNKKTGRIVLFLAVIFHILILLIHGIFTFVLVMLSCLIFCYYESYK